MAGATGMTYFRIEARWDEDQKFEEIEMVFGSLDDAKRALSWWLSENYHSPGVENLTWLQGAPNDQGPIYYAHHAKATFRISP